MLYITILVIQYDVDIGDYYSMFFILSDGLCVIYFNYACNLVNLHEID